MALAFGSNRNAHTPPCVTENTSPKWNGTPTDKHEAEMALIGKHCIVCGAPMLLALIRPPRPEWLAHCNHCGTEMLIVVLLNRRVWREAWKHKCDRLRE